MRPASAPQEKSGRAKPYAQPYLEPDEGRMVADPIVERMSPEQLRRCSDATRKKMEEAARRLDFVEAAQLRDEMLRMQAKLEG